MPQHCQSLGSQVQIRPVCPRSCDGNAHSRARSPPRPHGSRRVARGGDLPAAGTSHQPGRRVRGGCRNPGQRAGGRRISHPPLVGLEGLPTWTADVWSPGPPAGRGPERCAAVRAEVDVSGQGHAHQGAAPVGVGCRCRWMRGVPRVVPSSTHRAWVRCRRLRGAAERIRCTHTQLHSERYPDPVTDDHLSKPSAGAARLSQQTAAHGFGGTQSQHARRRAYLRGNGCTRQGIIGFPRQERRRVVPRSSPSFCEGGSS
jgi:hypothetical protein